jgi:hypothetical protein
MQDLAAEKVEWPQGFEKQQGRRGHASFDYQMSHLLQQDGFLRSEPHLSWRQGEGVDELLA